MELAQTNKCADRYVFRAYAAFYARRGACDAIESTIRRMRELRIAHDAHIITSLAHAYHSRMHHEMVISTVQRIVDEGLEMNANAAGLMIHALAHIGDLHGALQWYYQMCNCRMEPMVMVFRALLRVIAEKGSYEELMLVLRDMHNSGLYADSAMHFHIIRFYIRHGDTENAKAAFEHMKKIGLAPKQQTYAVMLQALAKNGETERGEEIVKEMAELGLGHTKYTYNAMMAIHAKEGNGEKIENVVEEMEKQGIKPEVGGYNMRIAAWAASGNVNKCEELVRELEERGITMDLYTISTMISCYGKKKAGVGENMVEKCKQWWHKMKILGLTPNLFTYNAMLNVYDKNNMVAECMKLYREMKNLQIRPNLITFNTLIHANVRDGNQFAVYTLRDDLVRKGMTPDKFTFMCLLKLSAKKAQDLQEVDGLREQMKNFGIQLDVQMYTTLLDVYGKHKNLEKCKQVWQEMKEGGISPTEVTFEVLRKHSMDKWIQQQNIFVPSENG